VSRGPPRIAARERAYPGEGQVDGADDQVCRIQTNRGVFYLAAVVGAAIIYFVIM